MEKTLNSIKCLGAIILAIIKTLKKCHMMVDGGGKEARDSKVAADFCPVSGAAVLEALGAPDLKNNLGSVCHRLDEVVASEDGGGATVGEVGDLLGFSLAVLERWQGELLQKAFKSTGLVFDKKAKIQDEISRLEETVVANARRESYAAVKAEYDSLQAECESWAKKLKLAPPARCAVLNTEQGQRLVKFMTSERDRMAGMAARVSGRQGKASIGDRMAAKSGQAQPATAPKPALAVKPAVKKPEKDRPRKAAPPKGTLADQLAAAAPTVGLAVNAADLPAPKPEATAPETETAPASAAAAG